MANRTPDKDYSAIHGNFIPLQSPDGLFLIPPRHPRSPRRLRSRSPRRRQEPGVHLHLSLTDAQMDTLTSTLTKDEAREARQPRHEDREYKLPATVYRSPSPGRSASPMRATSPMRAPLRTPDTRTSTAASSGGGRSPAAAWTHPHPSYADQMPEEGTTDTSSSVYSMDELARMLPHIHPLYVQKMAPDREGEGPLPGPSPGSPGQSPGPSPGPSPGQSPGRTYKHDEYRADTQAYQAHQLDHANHPPYSPPEPTFPRKGKVLVGRNGWLERTGHPSTPPAKPSGGLGLLDTLKRMAKATESRVRGSADGASASLPAAASPPSSRASAVAARTLCISLDPREQSLLYGELEFLLTAALAAFLDAQFHAGRLDAAQYKRVVDAWQRQGRPRVVGFRYDLETQLDLVQRHTHTHAHAHAQHKAATAFRFYGPRAADPVATAALLASMKVNARALRVRTFCQPDSAVAKQLLDSQALLALLGASEARQVQLAEVVQFFKTALEREGDTGRDTGLFREHSPLRPSRTAHSLDTGTSPRPGRATDRAATQRGRC